MNLNGLILGSVITILWVGYAVLPLEARSHGSRLTEMKPSEGSVCSSWVQVHGYQCQEFEVETKDGYILGMQRIPQGRAEVNATGKNRQPVILQHGVLVDGMTWLINPPSQSLAFIMADRGYDVWIANSRGTTSSRRHKYLSDLNPEFWAWTWDELASYDLTAVVEFVYSQTNQKINYVGHSQGTLIALVALSEGLLGDQLRSAALLTPIAYLSHMSTPVGVSAARAFLGELASSIGISEFNPKFKPITEFVKSLCTNSGIDCYDIVSSFTGKNCCLNSSSIQDLLDYEPQPTSTRNLVHLSQSFRDGVVARYDYENWFQNFKYYGRLKPPLYDLSKIPNDFPLFLSYGGLDALSAVQDVKQLLETLKMHDKDKIDVVYVDDYAHLDFIMGINARTIVYEPLISFFQKQNDK